MKTIVVTGGGSGGHITPVLSVAAELKKLDASVRVIYIGQKGDGLGDLPGQDPNIDEVHTVRAGKFRRYHGEGWRQLLDLRTQALNLRDLLYVALGVGQSFFLLRKIQPSVIFTRGGYVSVPVALGGRLNGIPYMTHDSDSVPSLANRLIASGAWLHGVALPPEIYPYPANKTQVVGVPVSHQYQPVTPRLMRHYRTLLQLQQYEQVLLVTGGGNGAQGLNNVIIANAPYLMKRYPKLAILHIAGRSLAAATSTAYDELLSPADRERVYVEGFVTDLYRYSGAADVIIARGGATNLAEFAVQGKACLIVPSTQLGWNVKNAQIMAKKDAIVYMSEDQAEQERRLALAVSELFDNETHRKQLARNLSALGHPESAAEIATLLLAGPRKPRRS